MRFIQFAAAHATLSEVILKKMTGQHLIRNLHATSDKAGSLIKFFLATCKTTADGSGATNQKVIPVAATTINGVAVGAGDYLIVFTATGIFMDIVASISAGVSITVTANLTYAVASGDEVYVIRAADISQRALGAASLSLEDIFAGSANMPCALRVDSTAAGYFSGLSEVIKE